MVAGDFNGDGVSDLAVANGADGDVSLLLGRKGGAMQDQTRIPLGSDASVFHAPQTLVAGDFFGDGLPDIVVGDVTTPPGSNVLIFGGLTLLQNLGGGQFRAADRLSLGPQATPLGLTVGDFNGDGLPDLAVTDSTFQLGDVFLNSGHGTFAPPAQFATQNGVVSLAAGDFNGDGHVDLATADAHFDDTGTTVSVLLGWGDGTFQQPPHFGTAGEAPAEVVSADFNGDGTPDVATLEVGSLIVSVQLGLSDGTLAPAFPVATELPVNATLLHLVSADFNGDGRPDLAVVSALGVVPSGPGVITLLLGLGDGTFASPKTIPLGHDLNVQTLLPRVVGTINGVQRTLIGNPNSPNLALVGDFNGDGLPDIVIGDFTSKDLTLLPGQRGGTFGARSSSGRRKPRSAWRQATSITTESRTSRS